MNGWVDEWMDGWIECNAMDTEEQGRYCELIQGSIPDTGL